MFVPVRIVVVWGEVAWLIWKLAERMGSKLSGEGPEPLVEPTIPPAPAPAPPAPAVVPPAPAPVTPAPIPPTPPPGVLETTPAFTPRGEPPDLVRRISVSAMGKL